MEFIECQGCAGQVPAFSARVEGQPVWFAFCWNCKVATEEQA